jgi:gluconolactonase
MKASAGWVFAALGVACSSTPNTPTGARSGQAEQTTADNGTGGGSSGAAGSTSAGAAGSATGGGAAAGAAGMGGAGDMAGAAGSSGSGGAGGTRFKCPGGQQYPVPEVGDPQTVCQGFDYNYGFSEGPTWVNGAFYFSNFVEDAQNGDTSGDIIKYTPGGDCEIWLEGTGTNGLAASITGTLLGASHKSRAVIEWNVSTKMPTTLSDMYLNQMLDSPNDLVQSDSGNIYFTNPTFELGGRPQGVGPAIFRRDPAGALTAIKLGPPEPNGVTLSPAADRLYVVSGGLWDLDAAGVASNNRQFPLDADGLAMDCASNVYLSVGSIRNPDGQEIGTFSGGTNLAFGGSDGKTLLVVGGGTNVKVMQTNVPGLP